MYYQNPQNTIFNDNKKGKAIPVTDRGGSHIF
jgi:hypothetical protein